MKGMAIIGPHEMPGLGPNQSVVQENNTQGNDLFNQGKYREAIQQYNGALGINDYDGS